MSDQQPTQQLERRPLDTALLNLSLRDPEEISRRLDNIRQNAHLISPITQGHELPEGTEIAFTEINVDNSSNSNDIFPVGGGKFALLKTPLEQISLAAGIRWGRPIKNDDGSDPHFCSRTYIGYFRQMDGTLVELPAGTAKIDLRDNGALCQEIYELKVDKCLEEASKAVGGKSLTVQQREAAMTDARRKADREIRRRRIKIEELCESGAQNRAIRKMGIRGSYKKDELNKPFVIVKLILTGKSADPQIRHDLTMKIADSMLDTRTLMFGEDRQEQPRQLASVPAVHTAHPIHDASDASAITVDDEGEPEGPSAEKTAATSEKVDEKTTTAKNEPADVDDDTGDVWVIPFGKHKNQKLAQVDDDSYIVWLLAAYDARIEDPEKATYLQANQAARSMILAECKKRGVGPYESEGSKKTSAGKSPRW